MKRKYLIMHLSGTGGRSLGLGGPEGKDKVWQLDTDELDSAKASQLGARDDVKISPVFPLTLVEPVPCQARNDNGLWGLSSVGADKSEFDGSDVVVAILDTGIDPDHEAFRNVKIARKNFTSGSDDDMHGHGTHCAGTIFGDSVGGVRIGIAPKIRKALIAKVLDPGGSTEQLFESIDWAAQNGASIINMSLGFDFPKMVEDLKKKGVPEKAAVSMALVDYRSTVSFFEHLHTFLESRYGPHSPLLVAAAGNESDRVGLKPFTIAAAPPAISEGYLSVAALGAENDGYSVADFSNAGVNVAAPGVNVASAALGGGLVSLSGTSMAAPHVTGVAALWMQKLAAEKQANSKLLSAKLIAFAQHDRIIPGFSSDDYGSGIVQAP